MNIIDTSVCRKNIYVQFTKTITEKMAVVSCLGAGTYTLTLPTARDAAGLIFCFRCDDVDQAAAASIAIDNEATDSDNIYIGAAAVAGSITMNVIDDYTILYSDGNNWYQLAGGQTA